MRKELKEYPYRILPVDPLKFWADLYMNNPPQSATEKQTTKYPGQTFRPPQNVIDTYSCCVHNGIGFNWGRVEWEQDERQGCEGASQKRNILGVGSVPPFWNSKLVFVLAIMLKMKWSFSQHTVAAMMRLISTKQVRCLG